ncbi:hypothetical protein HanHA300_Chr01g0003161 [Helianthus annuus]|nr:hypothetical protein HanHA300_Chr01g0003161 [Helianthus annuus]
MEEGKGRKAQVKGKRPRVGNPSTDHSYLTTEEEELDIEEEGHLFWFCFCLGHEYIHTYILVLFMSIILYNCLIIKET